MKLFRLSDLVTGLVMAPFVVMAIALYVVGNSGAFLTNRRKLPPVGRPTGPNTHKGKVYLVKK